LVYSRIIQKTKSPLKGSGQTESTLSFSFCLLQRLTHTFIHHQIIPRYLKNNHESTNLDNFHRSDTPIPQKKTP
jgi:hypothetical protein